MILDAMCNGYPCVVLNYLRADALWMSSDTSRLRPVFLQIAASTHVMRPIVAALRLGHTIEWAKDRFNKHKERIEILKTAPYEWHVSKTSTGSLLTIYHAPLCRIDPDLVSDQVRFVCLPPTWWIAQQGTQSIDLWAIKQLDRRTKCPVIPGQGFASLVMKLAVERGFVETKQDRTCECGFSDYYLWKSTQAEAQQLLADCVHIHKHTSMEAA